MPRAPVHLALLTLALAGCRHAAEPVDRSAALVEAARDGRLGEVLALLDAGADPNGISAKGELPAGTAVAAGADTILAELLADGADPLRADRAGLTALDRAVLSDRPDATERIIRHLATVAGAGPRALAWFDAVTSGAPVPKWTDVLNGEVLAFGVLHAALHDRADVLATMGRAREISNRTGYSPLALAARWGREHAVAALLRIDSHPDLPLVGPWQASPLMYAAGAGHDEIVGRLLGAGARVDRRDAEGNAALHWAARAGQGGAARQLLARGADPSMRNLAGRTPGELAEAAGHPDVAAILAGGSAP